MSVRPVTRLPVSFFRDYLGWTDVEDGAHGYTSELAANGSVIGRYEVVADEDYDEEDES